uniref:Uncharacterized protein n=1 Tax=Avena sativa TaxID=4498 RepID=A0ACD5WUM3_AVESA
MRNMQLLAASPAATDEAPILTAPRSTPPRQLKRRRKTMAGVSSFAGFPVRSSPCLKAKGKDMPIAKMAEKLLCQRMGIVDEGKEVTEAANAKFIEMFDGRLLDIAIAAMRALFRLDCDFATAVEDALLEHGGAAALEQADAQAMPS